MTQLAGKAQQIVSIIEDAWSSGYAGPDHEQRMKEIVQFMVWDLGGRNLPPDATLSGATHYLLMLWLARGMP